MTEYRISFRLMPLVLALITSLSAMADIDKKYYEKIADEVWGSDMPGFDPATALDDSIFQGQSAVYIARYYGITGDYDNEPNMLKRQVIGIPVGNATVATYVKRFMVKINDATAAEDFTEFSISPDKKYETRGYTYYSIRCSFGARIFKPDGSVTVVDLDDVMTKKGGKKDKDDVEYKIAIPGLSAGDVLDYFYQVDYMADEMHLDEFTLPLLVKYPTKLLTIDVRTDPRLNMEYGAYNGAPVINDFKVDESGHNVFYLQMKDVYGLDESIPYFSAARQMPFFEIYVHNNNSPKFSYVPNMMRRGGMRYASPIYVMRDIAFSIRDTKEDNKLIGEAASIVKSWKKSHADATDVDVADAAWIALKYAAVKQGDKMSKRLMAKNFYRLIERVLPQTVVRLGVGSSRNNVAIGEVAHFNDPDYFAIIGDRLYMPGNYFTQLPGEIPPYYDGEGCVIYSVSIDAPELYKWAKEGKFSASKPAANTTKKVVKATVDADDADLIDVETELSFSGTKKRTYPRMVTSHRYIEDMERYLGVKPGKIKPESDVQEQEDKINENLEEIVKVLWNADEARLDSVEVISSGSVPDSPESVFRIKGSAPGLISRAGNNLVVNVGSLIGKQAKITGSHRTRDVSVLSDGPGVTDCTVIFTIPEGYELVTESLDDLNRSVATPYGTFNSGASVNGNEVKIRVNERYTQSVYPDTAWPDLLRLYDASSDFNSASIVCRPLR